MIKKPNMWTKDLRNNTITCEGKVISTFHNDVNLNPKLLNSQLYGSWEEVLGLHNCAAPNLKRLIGMAAPADVLHIMDVSRKPKKIITNKISYRGIEPETIDVVADTSIKVR